MSTSQQSHDVHVVLVNRNSGGSCGGGGGVAVSGQPQVASSSVGQPGEPPSSEGNEIVRISENNGNNKDKDERRESNVSDCSVEIVDLESEAHETKIYLPITERDCRICHLSMDVTNQDSGVPIELGCSCKDDLSAAHKKCAEAWFKIKGNKICEICGSIAQNVGGINEAELMEPWTETNDAAATTATASAYLSGSRNFWQGHRFLNFLLACMVFAFVMSWLFHFNVIKQIQS